jgi:protein-tyrosine phosphatase
MGNICRSPAAEAVMKSVIEKHELNSKFHVDSCGTIAHHIGEKADSRMIGEGSKRGYKLTSIARKFNNPSDFEDFDLIIAMDNDNYADIMALDKNKAYINKIYKLTSFCKNTDIDHVPDPYYGTENNFNLVLDILEDACKEIFQKVKA